MHYARLTRRLRIFSYLYQVEEIVKKLNPYLPQGTAPIIAKWIRNTACELRITGSRSSKFGDYRHPYKELGHRISINNDLNVYAFLVTLVHEFAHLKTWEEHRNRVKPHGTAWKTNFRLLMQPFFEMGSFPEDIHAAIMAYLKNPAASSCTDLNLFRTLRRYDPVRDEPSKTHGPVLIEQIPDGQYFLFRGKRLFQKLKKERTRFRCLEVNTQRIYLFSPIAEILPISEKPDQQKMGII